METGTPWDPSTHTQEEIEELKQQLSSRSNLDNVPKELLELLDYTRSLDFNQKPDYDKYLRNINRAAKKLGIDINDNVFDWALLATLIKHYPQVYEDMLIQFYEKHELDQQPIILDKKGGLIYDILSHDKKAEVLERAAKFELSDYWEL